MAGKDPRDAQEIPDLDLPSRSVKTSAGPTVPTSARPKPEPAASLGEDFDMEIERGGAMISHPRASSGHPAMKVSSGTPATPSGRLASSGLDVAYRRVGAKPMAETGPSVAQKMIAWIVPLVLLLGTAFGLVKLAHRTGGRSLTRTLPHALDASSTVQSGAFAGGALVLAITLGFVGLKLRPRSYAIIASAAALVIASLAMVTVTLVSTEEHPAPPDGALLIPYLVPIAVFLIGLGVAGRGPSLFLKGGAGRLGAVVVGLCGGAIVFAAVEISTLASRLP